MKNSIDLISKPLCEILNSSIDNGIIPDQLKIARIVPIFKSGDNSLFSNYRPISVLPVFSKILVKAVYRFYLETNLVFEKNHSTSHALINLYDQISTGLDTNKHTVGIFLDLSKAFDTVDHEINQINKSFLVHSFIQTDWLFSRCCTLFIASRCSDPSLVNSTIG